DGSLLLRVVPGNDERLGNQVAGPAFVFFLALLVGLDDAIRFGLPAVGGDQIAIVLHSLRPVIHKVLIDVITVDEWLIGIVGEQILGRARDDLFWVAAGLQCSERFGGFVPPDGEVRVHTRDK